MGQKSTVRALPPAILAEVNRLLQDDVSLDRIVDHLKSFEVAGDIDKAPSRSAVHRYSQDFSAVAAKLRESREVVSALTKELGPDATEGKQGRLLVEILRKLAFDSLSKQLDPETEGEGLSPGDFMFLAKALKEMSQATRLDQDFETKLREQIGKETKDKAGRAVDSVAKERGLTPSVVDSLKRAIIGEIDAKPPAQAGVA